MLGYLEYLNEHLNMPTKAVVALVFIVLCMNIIGEILEFKGKVVPEFVKIRKYFTRKKQEHQDTVNTLKEVKTLLADVNKHYDTDNITKRDSWMQWVNGRAKVYDASVEELTSLKDALAANNELTLDLYINVNRNRIIDFASKIVNDKIAVSREEFNRIFKVYADYESILEKYNKTNGEVDIAYRIITESYEKHMKNQSFIEDVRGY
jgi:hypothetical protein